LPFLTTLLLASCLSPKIKDTVAPSFNRYALSADLKVPANYYTTKTALFCNMERALQKQTKVQVKFRLGSVEQTQKLEGYHSSTLPSSLLPR
jgi:hypothetical protein